MKILLSIALLCYMGCNHKDQSGVLKKILYGKGKDFFLLNPQNEHLVRVKKVNNTFVSEIEGMTVYDCFNLITFSTKNGVSVFNINSKTPQLNLHKDIVGKILDSNHIIISSHSDSLTHLITLSTNERITISVKEVHKAVFGMNSMLFKDGNVFLYYNDSIYSYDVERKYLNYIKLAERAVDIYGSALFVDSIIIRDSFLNSKQWALSLFSLNSGKHIADIPLAKACRLLNQHSIVANENSVLILARNNDRLFQAGFGDYFFINLNNLKLIPQPSFDEKFRFDSFCGFVGPKMEKLLEVEEIQN